MMPSRAHSRLGSKRRAKVLHRVVGLPLMQQSPALVGVRDGIFGILRQRRIDRPSRFLLATQIDQCHRPQIITADMIRIARQPLFGRRQRLLPAIAICLDPGQDMKVLRVPGLQSNRFQDCRLSVVQPVSFPVNCRQRVKAQRFIRRIMNRLLRLHRRVIELVSLQQAQ
jgi:hypothetical protein